MSVVTVSLQLLLGGALFVHRWLNGLDRIKTKLDPYPPVTGFLGLSWGSLGALLEILGDSHPGLSWGLLGSPGALLGLSWDANHLSRAKNNPRMRICLPGCYFLGSLGALLELLGAFLGSLGALLELP